jgi:hypothetical protein
MPSALAWADHPRPNIFQKDRYSISSVALVVELFSRAKIKISVQLDIINMSKLMMPSQGEMKRQVICSNMQVMPKCFTWKERRGFSNGLGSLDNLLAEWKEIWKKITNCRQESRGHHERGSLANTCLKFVLD